MFIIQDKTEWLKRVREEWTMKLSDIRGVASWQKALGHTDWRIRAMAIRSLGIHSSKISLPLLVKALTDKHAVVRMAALDTCTLQCQHIPVLLVEVALTDLEVGVRAKAAWALSYFAECVPVDRLTQVVEDGTEDIAVRVSALYTLAIAGPWMPLGVVLVALEDECYQLREMAALSLRHCAGCAVIPPLSQALHDAEPRVRAAAALTLGCFGKRVPETALQAMLTDKVAVVREAVAWALEARCRDNGTG